MSKCASSLPPIALAEHFLRLAQPRLGRRGLRLTTSDVRRLEQYDWPGNVRELASVIERAAILARGNRLAIEAGLPEVGSRTRSVTVRAPPGRPLDRSEIGVIETEAEVRVRERANIVIALERSGGKIYGSGGAAELLRVPPTTLASRLRALGISRPRRGP